MAHPRSRGENFQTEVMPRLQAGSSPLTRGKQTRQGRTSHMKGLIPAHAGKTRSPISCPIPLKAHPRSRGENERPRGGYQVRAGSSPLTRGKPEGKRPVHEDARLIPAHAGKTRAVASQRELRRAHPRSRGENFPDDCVHVGVTGSSPLTRGKRPPGSPRPRLPGLIPAHAGKTRFSR